MSHTSEMVVLLECDGCGRKSHDGEGWISWQENGREVHNCQRCQQHAIDVHEIGAG